MTAPLTARARVLTPQKHGCDGPNALAAELRRLWFDVRRPHLFYERRRELAARVAELCAASPCSSCPAQNLRHALDGARRTARAAQARADRAERLLASAVRRSGRSRAHTTNNQLELFR